MDGMEGMSYSPLPKDMDWTILTNFDGTAVGGVDTAGGTGGGSGGIIPGVGGIANQDLRDFFAETTA